MSAFLRNLALRGAGRPAASSLLAPRAPVVAAGPVIEWPGDAVESVEPVGPAVANALASRPTPPETSAPTRAPREVPTVEPPSEQPTVPLEAASRLSTPTPGPTLGVAKVEAPQPKLPLSSLTPKPSLTVTDTETAEPTTLSGVESTRIQAPRQSLAPASSSPTGMLLQPKHSERHDPNVEATRTIENHIQEVTSVAADARSGPTPPERSVEIRIGTIEVRAPRAQPEKARSAEPRTPAQPLGFERYAALRNYNWRRR